MAAVDENTLSMDEVAAAQAQLRHIATAHWGARALHTAVSLDLFSALAARPMSAGDLARSLGTHPRATEMLLNALCSMGLVDKRQDAYDNSAVARLFLQQGSDYFQGQLIGMYGSGWKRWERLEDAVRRGGLDPQDHEPLGADFTRSMSNSAAVAAPLAARRLDLSRVKRLLDVGGGPGMYSIAMAQARAELRAFVLDLEPATAVANEYIQAAGLADRVSTITADYHQADFGQSQYEMVLLSNVLHSNSLDQCKALLRKAYDAVVSEAPCVVNELLLKDDKTGPMASTLFGLNMLLNTASGQAFSGWELTDLMQTIGFIRLQILPLDPTPYSLVIGYHP